MKKFVSLYVGCHFCLFSARTVGQNLENIGKKDQVDISGGASLNQVFYKSFSSDTRRDPYSYVASANLNVGVFGWSVPLSFTFSNQQSNFRQPFNQYSLHPTYKSVHSHIGYVSASYSPYTVNGHMFLGAAVDYEPEEKISIGIFYGRFVKATAYDSSAVDLVPSYARKGYGARISYNHANTSASANFFSAQDDITSLYLPSDTIDLLPQANFAAGVMGSQRLFERIILKAEYASSAVTSNINTDIQRSDHLLGRITPIFVPRESSAFFNAYKLSSDYQHGLFTVGLAFEHIDPGYRTLGAYYFNSDLENLTLNLSTTLVKGKVSLATSIGSQRDNLDNTKLATTRRSVGSLTANINPSERLTTTISYSSFQTFANIQSQFQQINSLSPYENIDTLNFTQLSRSGNINVSYQIGATSETRKSLNLTASVQGTSDAQADAAGSASYFYNANCAYVMNVKSRDLNLTISINGNRVQTSGVPNSTTLGPVLSCSKSMLSKKLRLQGSASYNSLLQHNRISDVITVRSGASCRIKGQHNLTLSVTGLQRTSWEVTALLGYSYSFTKNTFKKHS